MFSCMPFLTPILIKSSNNIKQSLAVMIPFSLGRIFTYTMIAMLAFGSSLFIKELLKNNTLLSYILGTVTIILGITMLYNSYKNNKSCGIHKLLVKEQSFSKLGFFTMGATISINLCTPVISLITISSSTTTIYSAIAFGIVFGVGAVLFTLLFYGFFFSTLIRGLLEQFTQYKKPVEVIASLFLILVGILIISGNMSL
ncbi:MAG: sulfite exporter TauE/SafE family protein [Arcobacteraceae bacterium]|nr:sulfite exporter TauE/SafE family protein [Arcobacteraceae bacterium]